MYRERKLVCACKVDYFFNVPYLILSMPYMIYHYANRNDCETIDRLQRIMCIKYITAITNTTIPTVYDGRVYHHASSSFFLYSVLYVLPIF